MRRLKAIDQAVISVKNHHACFFRGSRKFIILYNHHDTQTPLPTPQPDLDETSSAQSSSSARSLSNTQHASRSVSR